MKKSQDGMCVLTKADKTLMREHVISEIAYEDLYEQLLTATQHWGTDAMAAVQKQVTADVMAGLWDD